MKPKAGKHNFSRFDLRLFIVQISPEPKYDFDRTKSYRLKMGREKQLDLACGTHYMRLALDHNYLFYTDVRTHEDYDEENNDNAHEIEYEQFDFILPKRFKRSEGDGLERDVHPGAGQVCQFTD